MELGPLGTALVDVPFYDISRKGGRVWPAIPFSNSSQSLQHLSPCAEQSTYKHRRLEPLLDQVSSLLRHCGRAFALYILEHEQSIVSI
jgi:hypothetical protein